VLATWVYLAANWGEGYKLPSFFALGDPLTGNADLVPETSESWDVTANFTFGEHHTALTYFDNHFKNLVTFDDINFINVNSEPVDTSGVEWQWHWQPAQIPVQLQAQITYTDINPDNPELLLTGRSQWQAGIYAAWNFTPDWNLSLNYRYSGEQYAGSQHTGSGTVTELDSYYRLDAAVYWDVNALVRLNAALDNAFDESYETAVGFPAPGRSLRMGIRISL
jgi:outer membrane cobalamin receptor